MLGEREERGDDDMREKGKSGGGERRWGEAQRDIREIPRWKFTAAYISESRLCFPVRGITSTDPQLNCFTITSTDPQLNCL